jgi:hypothetical protein
MRQLLNNSNRISQCLRIRPGIKLLAEIKLIKQLPIKLIRPLEIRLPQATRQLVIRQPLIRLDWDKRHQMPLKVQEAQPYYPNHRVEPIRTKH